MGETRSDQVQIDWPCAKCKYNVRGLPAGGKCPECGTPIPAQIAGPGAVGPGPLEGEWPCLSCGYSLRGLLPSGVCPECGTPIQRSLQGNRLEFSGEEYLARLHNGVFLIQVGIIVQFILTVGSIVASFALGIAGAVPSGGVWVMSRVTLAQITGLIGVGAGIVSLVGWWLLSSPDPAVVGTETGANARKVVRATVAINTAALAVTFAFTFSSAPGFNYRNPSPNPLALLSLLATLTSVVAGVVWFFAAMRYLRWLAPRIPNQRVLAQAKRLMWLGPLLYTVGALVCGLGPLAALVLYYNLLDWVRKDLKAIREKRALMAAAGL